MLLTAARVHFIPFSHPFEFCASIHRRRRHRRRRPLAVLCCCFELSLFVKEAEHSFLSSPSDIRQRRRSKRGLIIFISVVTRV